MAVALSIQRSPTPRPAIDRLPLEILGQIFSHLIPTNEKPIKWWKNWSYLHRIAFVCRKWSRAAGITPLLWTHACPSWLPRQQLEYFLGKSEDLQLDVMLRYEMLSKDSWVVLEAHVPRFRELTISFPDRECFMIDIFEDTPELRGFLASARSLATLNIEGNITGDISPLFDGSISTSQFFVLSSPSRVQWPTRIFGALTSLHIELGATYTSHEFFSSILETLRANLSLHHVDVCCETSNRWRPPIGYPLISLPFLEKLALITPRLAAKGLLSCLALPRTTRLYLDINLRADDFPADEDFPQSALESILPEDPTLLESLATIDALVVLSTHKSEIRLQASAHGQPVLVLKVGYATIMTEHDYSGPRDLTWLQEWALTIDDTLPAFQITDVEIAGDDITEQQTWTTFLQRLPAMQTLNVHASAEAVLLAIREMQEDFDVFDDMSCPELSTLRVIFWGSEDCSHVSALLSDIVQTRVSQGRRLRSTSIRFPHLLMWGQDSDHRSASPRRSQLQYLNLEDTRIVPDFLIHRTTRTSG